MTSRDFCFWLQGYFEIKADSNSELSQGQVDMIKRHLNLVFKHDIDPSIPDPTGELQAIHDGTPHAKPQIFSPQHPNKPPFQRPGNELPRC